MTRQHPLPCPNMDKPTIFCFTYFLNIYFKAQLKKDLASAVSQIVRD